jgi:hypothetical protein
MRMTGIGEFRRANVSRSASPVLVLRLYWRAICARVCRPLPSLKWGWDETGRQGRVSDYGGPHAPCVAEASLKRDP